MLTNVEWHTFARHGLTSTSIVVDLGANTGRFARKMRALFDCRVIAVEANPSLISLINPDQDEKIEVHNCAAVGNPEQKLVFVVDENNSLASRLESGIAASPKGISVNGFSLSQILDWSKRDYIDMVKIDVEGAEISLIKNCDAATLARIGQLTIEFHDFCGFVTTEDVNDVKRHLVASGFFGLNLSRVGHQDTIYLNRRFHQIGIAARLKMQIYKYAFGGSRLAAKILFGKRWNVRFD